MSLSSAQRAAERRAFERHCKSLLWEDRLERDSDGNYAEDYIDALWVGWMLKVECTSDSGTADCGSDAP
jgi:hypothetical protein